MTAKEGDENAHETALAQTPRKPRRRDQGAKQAPEMEAALSCYSRKALPMVWVCVLLPLSAVSVEVHHFDVAPADY